jgi:hypothetical protein
MLNNLRANLKQDFLAASTKSLRGAFIYPSNMISFVDICKMKNRAQLICFAIINCYYYCTKFTMNNPWTGVAAF